MSLNVELVEVEEEEVNRCNPPWLVNVVVLLLTVDEVGLYETGHVAFSCFCGSV